MAQFVEQYLGFGAFHDADPGVISDMIPYRDRLDNVAHCDRI